MLEYIRCFRVVHRKTVYVPGTALRQSWNSFILRWNTEEGFEGFLMHRERMLGENRLTQLLDRVHSACYLEDRLCYVHIVHGCRRRRRYKTGRMRLLVVRSMVMSNTMSRGSSVLAMTLGTPGLSGETLLPRRALV